MSQMDLTPEPAAGIQVSMEVLIRTLREQYGNLLAEQIEQAARYRAGVVVAEETINALQLENSELKRENARMARVIDLLPDTGAPDHPDHP